MPATVVMPAVALLRAPVDTVKELSPPVRSTPLEIAATFTVPAFTVAVDRVVVLIPA